MTRFKQKLILSVLSLLGMISTYGANTDPDPFGTINDSISSWIPGMKTLFNTLIILGILIGGVFTFYKMKTGEGSESKKAVMNFIAAILFAVTVRIFLGIFGG